MLGNMKLFLLLNRISHSFSLLTREISLSALDIFHIFQASMYYSLCNTVKLILSGDP